MDAQLPGLGGEPQGLPLPGELPAPGAAPVPDTGVPRAAERPASGRAHRPDGRAGVQAIPGRVHRGVPAHHRRRVRLHQGPRARRRSPAGAVRADQDRPAPVLLPPRRVRLRREAVRELGAVAAGRPAHRCRPGPAGARVRPGLRVLGDGGGRPGRGAADHRRGPLQQCRSAGVGRRGHPAGRAPLLLPQSQRRVGAGPDARHRAGRGRHDRRHRARRAPSDETRVGPYVDPGVLRLHGHSAAARRQRRGNPADPPAGGRGAGAQPRAVRRGPAVPAGRRRAGDRRAGEAGVRRRRGCRRQGRRGYSSTR